MRKAFNIGWAVAVWAVLIVAPWDRACGDNTWKSIETEKTILRYQSLEDLRKLDAKIDFLAGSWRFTNLFSASGAEGPVISLNKKLDAMYGKIQEILEMHGKMDKVIIQLYPDRQRLHEAYLGLTGQQCRTRAWYVYERNTIYLNAEDVYEGMLAHELAHAIIDRYLLVRPPRATAEILAYHVYQEIAR